MLKQIVFASSFCVIVSCILNLSIENAIQSPHFWTIMVCSSIIMNMIGDKLFNNNQ